MAEPVKEADLSTRRDGGLQMVLLGPHSSAATPVVLLEHPGRMSVCQHWFSPRAMCFVFCFFKQFHLWPRGQVR